MTAFPIPEDAALHFVQTLQESVGCACRSVFNYPLSKPLGTAQSVVLNRGVDVPVGGGLYLSAGHWYTVVAADGGGYVVRTGGYAYGIESDQHGGELASWQWHPGGSWCTWPHLHARSPMGDHLPTGRVALEQVVRWLIEEAKIPPLRPDWDALLTRNEDDWRARRTWA